MGKKLYVGNLGYEVTSDDLSKMFEAHGTVESAQVIMDRDTGRSKGFWFRGDEDRPGGPGGHHCPERPRLGRPLPHCQRSETPDRRGQGRIRWAWRTTRPLRRPPLLTASPFTGERRDEPLRSHANRILLSKAPAPHRRPSRRKHAFTNARP